MHHLPTQASPFHINEYRCSFGSLGRFRVKCFGLVHNQAYVHIDFYMIVNLFLSRVKSGSIIMSGEY